MEATTEIKKIQLKDITNLSDGYYTIYPCDESDCIFKLFENIPENICISMSIQSYHSFFSRMSGKNDKIQMQLTESPRNIRENFRYNLLTSQSADLTLYPSWENSWNRYIKIGEARIEFHYISTKIKETLVEENGKFYIRTLGCNFPVSIWSNESDTNLNYNQADYMIRRLPIKVSDVSIINKLFSSVTSKPSIKNADGVAKTLVRIIPFYENLNVFESIAFAVAVDNTKKTLSNIKFSVIFNKLFEKVNDQESFNAVIKSMSEIFREYTGNVYLQKLMDVIPDARDVKKAALKRKSTGAFNKIMDDLDFVDIDQKLYPLTHEAVHSGDLPLGTFFRKTGESYFIYNDNWSLWEDMLLAYPEEAKQLANTCSGRTTYEKDLMSYFYFVLYKLPNYLEKHTGKKWKGIPKLVNSANELDPPKEGDNGVAKTRSALTPIVDNVNNTVIVPYVSMRISGYNTTYCYGLDYNVLERGLSWKGNVVTKDVESELNGKDDYGLMFYTLTGTAQGRGYPTFLIIFEKLIGSTRVHFHRVHPTRSKNGEYNSIHNWTTSCYKWMIGNVNFERIVAQQGDLAFVKIENENVDTEAAFMTDKAIEVNSYDSHCFKTPVKFIPYEKKEKSNVLGYFKIEKDTNLNHTEHVTRCIPKGIYELRQCRSWEANPKGIWSLRID